MTRKRHEKTTDRNNKKKTRESPRKDEKSTLPSYRNGLEIELELELELELNLNLNLDSNLFYSFHRLLPNRQKNVYHSNLFLPSFASFASFPLSYLKPPDLPSEPRPDETQAPEKPRRENHSGSEHTTTHSDDDNCTVLLYRS